MVRFHSELEVIMRSSVMRRKKCFVLPASVLPRLRVICGRDAALGPGRVQLLEPIGETGSLRSAAAVARLTSRGDRVLLVGKCVLWRQLEDWWKPTIDNMLSE